LPILNWVRLELVADKQVTQHAFSPFGFTNNQNFATEFFLKNKEFIQPTPKSQ
jgi:hypothetical protein